MSAAGDRVTPWLDRNCRRCDLAGRCEPGRRLATALKTWTPLDPKSVDRIGVPRDGLFGPWTCKEFVLIRRPPSPSASSDDAKESPGRSDPPNLPPDQAPASIE